MSNDNETESSPTSLSTMTCESLTGFLGGDESMWSAGASLVSRSPLLDLVAVRRTSAICGPTPYESFARYAPDSHSWRTSQGSLALGISDAFSETWPRAGTMRSGRVSERTTAERPTDESDSGYWPTIRSEDANRGGRGDLIQAVRGNPNSHYKLWPTPTRGDSKSSGSAGYSTASGRHSGTTLTDATARVLGGQLNPTWVEWLMGWPLGSTDSQPLETDRFRSWLQQHGAS